MLSEALYICFCLLHQKTHAAFIGWCFIWKLQGILNLEYHETETGHSVVPTIKDGCASLPVQHCFYSFRATYMLMEFCTLQNVLVSWNKVQLWTL
jgi:hypothetical protein